MFESYLWIHSLSISLWLSNEAISLKTKTSYFFQLIYLSISKKQKPLKY